MENAGIAFYVLGAFVTLYIVAATWRSRDTGDPLRRGRASAPPATQGIERRIIHAWRAKRRERREARL